VDLVPHHSKVSDQCGVVMGAERQGGSRCVAGNRRQAGPVNNDLGNHRTKILVTGATGFLGTNFDLQYFGQGGMKSALSGFSIQLFFKEV